MLQQIISACFISFACVIGFSARAGSSAYVEVGESGRSADSIENKKVYSLFPAWTNANYRCTTLDKRLTAIGDDISKVQELIKLKKKSNQIVYGEERTLKDLLAQRKTIEDVRPKEYLKKLELEREIDVWKSKLAPGVATKLTTKTTPTNNPNTNSKIGSEYKTPQVGRPKKQALSSTASATPTNNPSTIDGGSTVTR